MPMKGSETRCFCSFSLAILVKHCMSSAWCQNSSISIIRLDAVWHLILKSGRWQTCTQCINRNSWWRLPYRTTRWILTIFINFPSSPAALEWQTGWQTGTPDREGLGSNYWPLLDSGHSFSVVIIMLLAYFIHPTRAGSRWVASSNPIMCRRRRIVVASQLWFEYCWGGKPCDLWLSDFSKMRSKQPCNLVHHLLRCFVWSRMKEAATLDCSPNFRVVDINRCCQNRFIRAFSSLRFALRVNIFLQFRDVRT